MRPVTKFPLFDVKRLTEIDAGIGKWNCFAHTYRGEISHFGFDKC